MVNESGSQNKDSLKVNIAAILSLSVLSFFILIPVVNNISIPLEKSNAGIISLANAININPYTEYVKFLILLLAPLIVAVIALNTNQVLVNRYWKVVSGIIGKLISFLSNKRFFLVLTLTLLFIWSVNRNYIFLSFTLNDPFHEGEYLGFLPNFLALRKPFLESFMIHGFGLDVLPSLIANSLATNSNVIALTRFFRMTEGMIIYLGCFWVIWELVSLNRFSNISRPKVFLLSSILFVILDGPLFKYRTDVLVGRDTLFILQLALTIRFFRIASNKGIQSKLQEIALPILIGITIPASVLYVYDRAAYFFFVYLLACVLAIFLGKRLSRIWLCGSILGFTISAIAILIALGFDQVAEISSQMSYWIRYGKYITFIPPPPLSFQNVIDFLDRESITFWKYFVSATLVNIFAIFYLILNYKKNSRSGSFWNNNYSIIILLFTSLLYMRITIDRSPDAGSGSLVTALLLIYLCLSTFKTHLEDQANQILLNPPLKRWIIGLLTIIILIHPVLNPLLIRGKLERLYRSYRTPDIQVERRDFLASYQALKPELDQSPCFYTLTSEGFWYYLFKKQTCSKFSILGYAKTTSAQETIIHDVDNRKPNIILFYTGGDIIGRLPVVDSNPIVYQYFLNHYRPHALVAGRWFWKRNEKKLTFTTSNSGVYGSIDAIDTAKPDTNEVNHERISNGSSNQIRRADQAWLSGISSLINQDTSTNAVYISYGDDNRLVSVAWVGQDSTWRARIPTLSLPAVNNSVIRAWGYDAKSSQLVKVGQDIKINLTSSAQG